MKKLIILFLMIFITFSTGCSEDTRSAKQILLDSIEKSTEVENTTYSGIIEIGKASNTGTEINETTSALQMLNKFNITFNGKTTNNPLQMEMNTTTITSVQGMDLTFEVPIIAKNDSIYFKIPAMLQSMMPTLNKEYLEMDISKKNNADYRTDSTKLFKTIINDFDDSSFVKKEENSYSIKNVNIENVVAISITQESIKPFLENFVIDGLPELINYLDKYSLAEEQKIRIEQLKLELDNKTTSIDKIISDINQVLTINKIDMINIYDKNGFLREIIFDIDVTIVDAQKGDLNLAIKGEYIIETINKDIKFEMQAPTEDQAEKIEELNLF